ncbi:hypothetical protein G6F31_014233 [Rhizopus arrhizus]|nr:hypothetical protein G6F31_014233 [Rhizopus arrhizus]
MSPAWPILLRGQIRRDGVFQLVQCGVQLARLHHAVAVVALEAGAGIKQQRLHHVGHAQGLAGGIAQRHGRHVVRPFVKILGTGGIVRVRPLGQPAGEQRRVRGQERQEHQGDHRVEQRVEVGDGAGRVAGHFAHQRLQHRQQQQAGQHAEHPGQQVAQRQPARGGVVARHAFDHRIDGGAQVGAQHQRKGHVRGDHVVAGQRHHEHDYGHAGVRGPGEGGRQQHRGDGLGGQGVQDHAQHGGGLEGLEQFNQLVQRQQQQPQADEHPAQVAGAAGRIAAEHPHARQDQDRGERGQVEGQQLDDQRGADVGPQHGGQGRHQADDPAGGKAGDHQAGGGAALQGGRDAQAGGEGAQAGAQRLAQRRAQGGPEGALDAGLDHVHAPEKQCDISGEVKQGNKSRHPGVFPFFL